MKHGLLVIATVIATLALAPMTTHAGDPDEPSSVQLSGRILCPSWASPDAHCDVRLGKHANAHRALGMTICTGPVPTGIRCDVALPSTAHRSARVAAEMKPRVVPMFGANICFGDVSPTTHCDVRLGGSSQTASLNRDASSTPL